MSGAGGIMVCASSDLLDGGKGVRFPVLAFGGKATGFVVRHGGTAYAYLNRCAHAPVELDWFEGEFFESCKTYLMCATHGATYAPESGACTGGPCRGGRLRPIALREEGGAVYWLPDQHIQAPAEAVDRAHQAGQAY